jgi:hypothetical protein
MPWHEIYERWIRKYERDRLQALSDLKKVSKKTKNQPFGKDAVALRSVLAQSRKSTSLVLCTSTSLLFRLFVYFRDSGQNWITTSSENALDARFRRQTIAKVNPEATVDENASSSLGRGRSPADFAAPPGLGFRAAGPMDWACNQGT